MYHLGYLTSPHIVYMAHCVYRYIASSTIGNTNVKSSSMRYVALVISPDCMQFIYVALPLTGLLALVSLDPRTLLHLLTPI